ncbi:MAG TPA: hypothetical protein VF607_06675, partial [Verrucomicrobiae bacterium]
MKRMTLGAAWIGLALFPLYAADRTWTGGGADNYWSTPANWGGTAPVANDNLIFAGGNRTNSTNDLTGLTVGWIRFANGGFTLGGNGLTLGSTLAAFTNVAGTNTVALNLTVAAANAQSWNVAVGSELRLAGGLTNSSAGNPLGLITGGGTVRCTAPGFGSTRMLTTFNGTLALDGGTAVISNDGFRLSPTNAVQTAAGWIDNNGSIQIGGNSSLRLGQLQNTLAAGTATMTVNGGTLWLQPAGDNGSPSYGGCITLGENP